MGLLKLLGRKYKRLFSFRSKDYLFLFEAWLMLMWVDLVIRFCSYERWYHWLESGEVNRDVGDKGRNIVLLISSAEMAARHHLFPMNCLRRTIAQKLMLARRGVIARLHIGIKKEDAGFEAHSWLSYCDKVLNDSPDVIERYVELERNKWRSAIPFSD